MRSAITAWSSPISRGPSSFVSRTFNDSSTKNFWIEIYDGFHTTPMRLIAEPIVAANPADLVGIETRSGPRCRFCDSSLRFTLVDLGMSPLCESYVTARAAESRRNVLSTARLRLRAMLPGSARGVCRSRGDLHRVCLLLILLR